MPLDLHLEMLCQRIELINVDRESILCGHAGTEHEKCTDADAGELNEPSDTESRTEHRHHRFKPTSLQNSLEQNAERTEDGRLNPES